MILCCCRNMVSRYAAVDWQKHSLRRFCAVSRIVCKEPLLMDRRSVKQGHK